VYIVEEGVLWRRDIDIAWQNDEEAIVSSGLVAGDRLVLTPLGQVTSGIRVTIIGEEDEQNRRRPPGNRAATAEESQ
jgi:hypothetical protein